MKRAMVLVLGVCVGVAWAQPEELTDPIAILKKVDAAAKAVKAAKYKATFKGTGGMESRVPTVEGTVIMSGWSGNMVTKFRCEAKIKQPGSEETMEVTAGSDGEEFYLIDHKAKKAYVDIDQNVMGAAGRPAQALLTVEFVHPRPFNDEINGKSQELKGSKTIGGEDCYEVHVAYAVADAQAIWHFSKKDFLPRARNDILKTPSGETGGQQRIITDLVIDPKLDDETFKFQLPEGYTKTDDFAP